MRIPSLMCFILEFSKNKKHFCLKGNQVLNLTDIHINNEQTLSLELRSYKKTSFSILHYSFLRYSSKILLSYSDSGNRPKRLYSQITLLS